MPKLTIFSVIVLSVVALGSFLVLGYLERLGAEGETREQKDQVLQEAREFQHRLTTQISEDVLVLQGLRAFIQVNPEITESEFNKYAASVKRTKPSIRSISAAPDMVIRYTFPLKGNEAVIGLDYRTAPVPQRAAAFRTIREGKPIVAGPVELVQGGRAFIVRLPVYIENNLGNTEVWGILAAPIDTGILYSRAGMQSFTEKYDVSIRGQDGLGYQGAVFYGDESLFSSDADSILLELELENGLWVMAVRPKEGWITVYSHQIALRWAFFIFVVVFSALWLSEAGYLRERLKGRRRNREIVREKAEFLEILSHEIRSPLQGVLGAQKYLLDNGITGSLRPIVETAYQSGEYINSLISDYLDLQRAESGNLKIVNEPVDIRAIIEKSFKIITAGKKGNTLAIRFLIPEDVPIFLLLDERKTRQILMNIIGNALKYTRRGFVSVTASYVSVKDNPTLVLKVEDTGIGIEKKELDTLFDRFTRTERGEYRAGSGLGLAITKTLVQAMGGSIEVKSEVGKGTCFLVKLPAEKAVAAESRETDMADVKPDLKMDRDSCAEQIGKIRVLVADDIVVNRVLMQAILSPLVATVVPVEDGVEVLKELEKSDFDLVIIDVHMPRLNGIEATKRIREKHKYRDLPIIGMTGEESVESQKLLIAAGMNTILTKPIKLDLILEKMEEVFCYGESGIDIQSED